MSWPEFLDELEDRLQEHERALRQEGRAPSALYVSDSMGPPPSELVPRVQELLGQLEGLEREVRRQRDVLAGVLARGAGAQERRAALYVDLRA